jgi:hypothetical protein
MEKSNKVERSEVWNNIYEVLARLDLKQVEGDSLDRPSAATEIEDAIKKLLPIHNVRLSCFKEVFEKFQEIEHESEFYGWLHAKAHEA